MAFYAALVLCSVFSHWKKLRCPVKHRRTSGKPFLMLYNQYGGYHSVDTRMNLSSETSAILYLAKRKLGSETDKWPSGCSIILRGYFHREKGKVHWNQGFHQQQNVVEGLKMGSINRSLSFFPYSQIHTAGMEVIFPFPVHTVISEEGENLVSITENWLMIVYCIHCRISFCLFFLWHQETIFFDLI